MPDDSSLPERVIPNMNTKEKGAFVDKKLPLNDFVDELLNESASDAQL
jgi:hypothetical protein